MALLKIGQTAPDFNGINQDGLSVKLSDYKGSKVILYFYPKDNTPGCTSEACDLRDNYEKLKSTGFEVIGVSPDSEKSHTGFRKKHNLPFQLLADTEKSIMEQYGVWGEKKMYGKNFMGVIRTTYLINENGIIEQVFDKVDTKAHADQILKSLK